MTDHSRLFNQLSLSKRLRAMPGFTAAVVAFCLTVVMGAGGTYAYALWNQSARAAINVSTGEPSPFTITCDDSAGDTATLEWVATGAERYSYIITSSTNNEAISGDGNRVVLDPDGGGILGGLTGSPTYWVKGYAHYGGSWTSMDQQQVDYTPPFLLVPGSVECVG